MLLILDLSCAFPPYILYNIVGSVTAIIVGVVLVTVKYLLNSAGGDSKNCVTVCTTNNSYIVCDTISNGYLVGCRPEIDWCGLLYYCI